MTELILTTKIELSRPLRRDNVVIPVGERGSVIDVDPETGDLVVWLHTFDALRHCRDLICIPAAEILDALSVTPD